MESLKGRNVIIVEDIIDTGKTMSELIPYFHSYGVKSVSVWINGSIYSSHACCLKRILL